MMKFATKLTSGIIATATVLGLIAAWRFIAAFDEIRNINNTNGLYTLSGKVINAQGQAVANARVIVFSESSMAQTSGSKTATTDKDNRFKIENISSGIYTVRVKSDNYETSNRLVRLNENKSLTIELKSPFQ